MTRPNSGKNVIFQKFSRNISNREFPYPPLYQEPNTDYICFTDDVRVYSSIWKIQVVENLMQTDLEPYLMEYAARWELKPEQIQMGKLLPDTDTNVLSGGLIDGNTVARPKAEENVITIPSLEELPLVEFNPEKLIPTADCEGNYIYRKNPIYNDGKYNGRPLLLTIGVPVSNQIETIERCLLHVKPLLEQLDAELLVVDTGSTDGTVEICRQYGARIISHPWHDNMSEVRNEGICNARGEWYLSIDDDEWFEDVEDILNFFKGGNYHNYDQATYIQRNYMDSGGIGYDDYHTLRMARITPGLHFEGRIHDALDVEPGLDRVCALHSYAHHYGFVSDNPKRRQEKFLRNATLLLQDIYEYPENLRYLFQMAQEYATINQNATAVSLFLKTIAMAKEGNFKSLGKNSVVILALTLYAMKDQRLFQWPKFLNPLFPLTAAERAYIAWVQETLAFLTGKAPKQVLEYYGVYERALEEYRQNSVLARGMTYFGLMAVEQESCIMDAKAMAFCSYLDADREEDAGEIFADISLEKIPEQRISVLAAGLAAENPVYEALCEKITSHQWEEWSEEIGNAFAAGIRNDFKYGRLLKRLPDVFSQLSVSAVSSWFERARERRGGNVGGRLLEYAMECRTEGCPVQVLFLCAKVLREAYLENREGKNARAFFRRYLLLLAVFAEGYYNEDLLMDAYCQAVPAEVRAVYRMAAVLSDGKASHENVATLRQALAIFPPFHEEIRTILMELSANG